MEFQFLQEVRGFGLSSSQTNKEPTNVVKRLIAANLTPTDLEYPVPLAR